MNLKSVVLLLLLALLAGCSGLDQNPVSPQTAQLVDSVASDTSTVIGKPGAEVMSSSRFSWGWCTWYAATEFDKVAPLPTCNWGGNAAQWYANASSQRWIEGGRYIRWVCLNASVTSAATSNIPNGSIVVWTDGGYGHVAVFRAWGQNGIHIQEMNWKGFGIVSSTFLTWSQVQNRGSYRFVGYITPRKAVL